MAEETTETTEQNPVEETTTVTETQQEVTDNTQQKTEHTDTEKRLYARTKEAEERAAKATAEAKRLKDEIAKSKLPISDVDAILEVTNSTKDLDTDEITELQLRAKALGTSLSKARGDKNYQLWQRGHREEIQKAKALAPNTNQPEVENKPKSLDEELLNAKTDEERLEILQRVGLDPFKKRNISYLPNQF